MTDNLPTWAVNPATPSDHLATKHAYENGTMQSNWYTCPSLKSWAKEQGWPTSWFNFQATFFKTMLENDANFALALIDSGLEITIPKQTYTFPDETLKKFDQAYDDHEWDWLVERLREIRRAVEAGVVVTIDGETLKSWSGFYTWAHGRYHVLEDGADKWIGDDS